MTNHCGDCSLCCKLLGVVEIEKPAHRWCQHYRRGTGCSIHEDPAKPASCEEYVCLWRQMRDEGKPIQDELRPDRCKVIIDASKFGPTHYVRCDPGYPSAWQRPIIQNMLGALADAGSSIMLVDAHRQRRLRVAIRSKQPLSM